MHMHLDSRPKLPMSPVHQALLTCISVDCSHGLACLIFATVDDICALQKLPWELRCLRHVQFELRESEQGWDMEPVHAVWPIPHGKFQISPEGSRTSFPQYPLQAGIGTPSRGGPRVSTEGHTLAQATSAPRKPHSSARRGDPRQSRISYPSNPIATKGGQDEIGRGWGPMASSYRRVFCVQGQIVKAMQRG